MKLLATTSIRAAGTCLVRVKSRGELPTPPEKNALSRKSPLLASSVPTSLPAALKLPDCALRHAAQAPHHRFSVAIEHVKVPIVAKAMQKAEDKLFQRISVILDGARTHVARSVNTAMVQAYWLMGREIVEVEQGGATRAAYGQDHLRVLAQRLSNQYGKGVGYKTLQRSRLFYQSFPKGSALPDVGFIPTIWSTVLSKSSPEAPPFKVKSFPKTLSWSHYLVLLKVPLEVARQFYEIEAARECWSVRELERQIGALLYERLAMKKTPLEKAAMSTKGQEVASAKDVLKDPFVLEFLGLQDFANLRESELEQAIIDKLETFLLEMGKGFCFVARQKRLTLESDHFYADLVFYNRLLRCFVVIDLKMGKLTHQDLGQMQMYVNYFDRFQKAPDDAKTIGIVLCSDKNNAMVKITLPDDNEQILAAKYQSHLPTEAQLLAELKREREAAERLLRLNR